MSRTHISAFGFIRWTFALVLSAVFAQCNLCADDMTPESPDEKYAKFFDDWFDRLSDAEPQNLATEFAAMEEAASESASAYPWPLAVAIRMIDRNVHVEPAAAFLLDHIESGHDHPTIDLNQSFMDTLVPTLLDRLVSNRCIIRWPPSRDLSGKSVF